MTTTLPAKTHAVQMSQTGGPEVIEFVEVEIPTPKPEELLIRVDWAGVNFRTSRLSHC